MRNKVFKLQESDNEALKGFVRKSKAELRAQILLLLNKGFKNVEIAKILDISHNTVGNVKKMYLEGECDYALYDKPRSPQPKKYGIGKETKIIALACIDPSKGHKRWTVRLIAETLREKEGFESITHQSVRLILKKTQKSHRLKKCGV
jgi:transposase